MSWVINLTLKPQAFECQANKLSLRGSTTQTVSHTHTRLNTELPVRSILSLLNNQTRFYPTGKNQNQLGAPHQTAACVLRVWHKKRKPVHERRRDSLYACV